MFVASLVGFQFLRIDSCKAFLGLRRFSLAFGIFNVIRISILNLLCFFIFFHHTAYGFHHLAELIICDENRILAIIEYALKHGGLETQLTEHLFLDGIWSYEIDNLDVVLLAKAIDATDTLFEN